MLWQYNVFIKPIKLLNHEVSPACDTLRTLNDERSNRSFESVLSNDSNRWQIIRAEAKKNFV